MNNSKLWLVVKPTVGIPIFLGAVAVGSFAVHVAVLSNTSWVSDFLKGQEMGSSQTASIDSSVVPAAATNDAVKLYSVSGADAVTGKEEMVIVLPDGRMATAVFDTPVELAANGVTPKTD